VLNPGGALALPARVIFFVKKKRNTGTFYNIEPWPGSAAGASIFLKFIEAEAL